MTFSRDERVPAWVAIWKHAPMRAYNGVGTLLVVHPLATPFSGERGVSSSRMHGYYEYISEEFFSFSSTASSAADTPSKGHAAPYRAARVVLSSSKANGSDGMASLLAAAGPTLAY